MWNPLPDYLQDDDQIVYDIDLEYDDLKKESLFFRKIKYRIGEIVIFFNELEKTIDECIIEIMNDRFEDSKIWALIQDFTFEKKTKSLFLIYLEELKFNNTSGDNLRNKLDNIGKEIDKLRIQRNIYIHANWINHSNLEYFESKVKHIKSKKTFLRVRKKITIEEIEKDIYSIQKVNEDLYEIHEEIFAHNW